MKINVRNDFSESPGGRYIYEGDYSGELFRDKILIPAYQKAENANEKLEINFDGCYGFGTSFLEEAFGGLVRKLKCRGSINRMIFIANDDETIPGLIEKYILEAEARLK